MIPSSVQNRRRPSCGTTNSSPSAEKKYSSFIDWFTRYMWLAMPVWVFTSPAVVMVRMPVIQVSG